MHRCNGRNTGLKYTGRKNVMLKNSGLENVARKMQKWEETKPNLISRTQAADTVADWEKCKLN